MAVTPSIGSSSSKTSSTTGCLSLSWETESHHEQQCRNCSVNFSTFKRRHHCYFCGETFCDFCSKQRSLIPPTSINLVPKVENANQKNIFDFSVANSFCDDEDVPLYGKGLEERCKLAREPLRVCDRCMVRLKPVQGVLRANNSNSVRYNTIDPTKIRRMFNSPLAFTLGHEVRKAAYTLNNLLPPPKRISFSSLSNSNQKIKLSNISPNLSNIDGVKIPTRLLQQAKGVAVLTIVKGGFGLGIEFGTGLVVARLKYGWSAPSAIGMMGLSLGALIGAQVTDHVFLLMTDAAVELMTNDEGSIQLGADVGIAVGPLGRTIEADLGTPLGDTGLCTGVVAPIYTYSFSKGLYVGVSLDGKVIMTRDWVNEKFYGGKVRPRDILYGEVPTPPAASPLYDALQRCQVCAASRNRNAMYRHNPAFDDSYSHTMPVDLTLPFFDNKQAITN